MAFFDNSLSYGSSVDEELIELTANFDNEVNNQIDLKPDTLTVIIYRKTTLMREGRLWRMMMKSKRQLLRRKESREETAKYTR